MEFNSSYFHTFGNPDFAAVFSGGGSSQAFRPCPAVDAAAAAGAKTEKGAARHTTARSSTVFCIPNAEPEEAHHFLDECSLCRKFLFGDIFMYRGDTPFCSEECRREQIEMDKTKHRRKKQNSPRAQAQAAAVRRERAPQLRQLQPQT